MYLFSAMLDGKASSSLDRLFVNNYCTNHLGCISAPSCTKFKSLPAFSYLFQIALSVMYLCCAVFFAITAHLYALHPSLLLEALLALLAASSTIILFIVDLANIWAIEWADSLSWITTVFSIVMMREWADRVYTMQRRHEKTGVLGRQLFEDEVVKSFFSQKDPGIIQQW